MCFWKKKEKSAKTIRMSEQSQSNIVTVDKLTGLDTDTTTYVSVPDRFVAITDVEGVGKQSLGAGLHEIRFGNQLQQVNAKVCYVNCEEIVTILWGTEQYDYMDSILQMPIRMAFRGSAKIKVGNVDKFVSAMVGSKSSLTVKDVDEYFTDFIATHVIKVTADVMISARISYVEYATHILDITANIKSSLSNMLQEEYGVAVSVFTIEPPHYADRAAMEKLAADLEAKRRLELRGSSFEKEEDKLQKNISDSHKRTMETIETVGKAMADDTTINIYNNGKVCPKCGKKVNAKDAFCPSCGNKL